MATRISEGVHERPEDLEIAHIALEDLRAEVSGDTVRQMASLAYRTFREPPWHDDLELPRLLFGLGVDLMRRGALAHIARVLPTRKVIGYLLGYEIVRASEDPRDVTLAQLVGSHEFDFLFGEGGRVFYGDTLCVDARYRQRGIGYQLSLASIEELCQAGFSYRIGRTSTAAHAMRRLYEKLGFEELPVRDATYPERTYWLMRL